MTRHRVEHLVLHLGKEQAGGRGVVGVVDRQSEQIADLLIETLFRRPNIPDAFKLFVEIVPSSSVLQAFVVHDETLDQELFQMGCGPLTELRTARRLHPVAYCQDHVQVVELDGPPHLARPFESNY
ncbi:hypothetical protein D3C72_1564140 [compost metagenome]